MNKNIILAYGSLKKGYGLNKVLKNSEYLGKARTTDNYTLIDGANFPFLIERNGKGAIGELYEVDAPTMLWLDKIEGHPNFYERKKILTTTENGDKIEVWAYIHPDVFGNDFNIIEEF